MTQRQDRDPRRWWTLAIALLGMTIAVIDTTVLNVSVPTIMRDLDTSLGSVQWVITGYALTFASMLVIGGRLGDIYGPRRLVMIGAAVFGVGSLLASISTSIPTLIVSKAIVEGIGAALLTPNTLSVIANTFDGEERTTAFAAWATAMGASSVFGPVLGGYLTTFHSWRWALRINVVIAPIVVIGLLLVARRDGYTGKRPRLDLTGALLIATGTFCIIFGLSQGGSYGYWRPIRDFTVLGQQVWPSAAPLSVVPIAFALGLVILAGFVLVEREKERRERDPLFPLSQFRSPTFGLTTVIGTLVSFSQMGTAYCLVLYLQGSRALSPARNGLWLLPATGASLVAAPLGGWLGRRLGATNVYRGSLALHALGLVVNAIMLSTHLSYWFLLPSFIVYGAGAGMLMSQSNRLILHDVDPRSTGAASGINTMTRQTAAACGVAVGGAIFALATQRYGIHAAIKPTMFTMLVALVAGLALTTRLPQIDRSPSDRSREVDPDAGPPADELDQEGRSGMIEPAVGRGG
jgi:EmrB/QacA subfamily drug resistance transporter